jgi:hypothetical protein
VAAWTWPTWVVSRRRVLEAVFVLLEYPFPSRRIFIGSHSIPPSGSPFRSFSEPRRHSASQLTYHYGPGSHTPQAEIPRHTHVDATSSPPNRAAAQPEPTSRPGNLAYSFCGHSSTQGRPIGVSTFLVSRANRLRGSHTTPTDEGPRPSPTAFRPLAKATASLKG